MIRRTLPAQLFLALALVAAATGLSAADKGAAMRDAGDYTIHYNAMPASELEPWVAERYGLPRTDDRCVVTVAVVDKESGEPVAAGIMASVTRSDGRMYKLDMRPIADSGGLYYVGEIPLGSATRLDFKLQVQPRQDLAPQTIRFQRRFGDG